MAVNIKFYYTLIVIALAVAGLSVGIGYPMVSYAVSEALPVQACVVARDEPLTTLSRAKVAACLGWHTDKSSSICLGSYQQQHLIPFDGNAIHVKADEVSLYEEGRSELNGHVEVQQAQQIVTAQTAYIYRDAKTNQVTKIELLREVRYLEPDRLMIAKKATINPQDKSGKVEDVLYLFSTQHAKAALPAWGRANFIERFSNKDFLLRKATYTTCPPQNKSWQIEADEISIDNKKEQGIARHAVLRIADWPLLYTP